jgi:hypothetical protein
MPTQITFVPSGPWNMTKYFSWDEDTTYGDLDIASPAYTGWQGVKRIEMNSDIDVELFYESGSGFTYYRAVDKARNFSVNVDFGVVDIALLQWMTTLPNFTTPALTLAKSRTFVIARKVNIAGTMTETYQILRNCVPSALEINLVQGQIVSGRATLVPRLISAPTGTSPYTTPTIPAAGSLSLPLWRPLDAGTGAITIATIANPVTAMTVRWNYGWAYDKLWGSELLDAATLAFLTCSGSMTVKQGFGFLERAKVETGSLQTTKFAAKAAMKTATGFFNFTDMTYARLTENLEYGSPNSTDEQFEFNAPTCTVTAS